MPPLPGEERLLTVFADVHYYFSAPTPKPLHHRFDKGSYVYLYNDSSRRRARIEIANNPGTPEQDAFHGTLDTAHFRYSHKFPTLCTITVDGPQSSSHGVSPPPDQQHEWRLASSDPRDEGRFLFRIHTIDLYFWTLEDATLFMSSAKEVLSSRQLEIPDPPQPSPRDVVSPVVQQLESVAISDPAYHNGQTRNSRSQSQAQSTTPLPPPPPPPMAPPALAQPAPVRTPEPTRSDESPTTFAPMAYNPAAPAAPEPIKHREKTPPPVDGVDGTGLAAAAAADHGFAPPPGQLPQSHYFTGPGGSAVPPYNASPQVPGVQHHASVSSATSGHRLSGAGAFTPANVQPGRQPSVTSPSFAPPPTAAQDPNAHLYGQTSPPPLQSPGAQIYGGSPPYAGTRPSPPHQPLQHLQPQYADYLQQQRPSAVQPQPPIGGYGSYDYSQPSQHHHQSVSNQGGNPYDVHQQVYRPTEAEAHSHSHRKSSSGGQKQGKTADRAEKVDKGVNRFLKKLEKKIG